MQQRDAEIYWVAGFFEGEGCFGWYGEHRQLPNRRKKWIGYPCAVVSQNDPEPLHRVAATFPGTVRLASVTAGGKDHWEYRVINTPAIDLMIELFPLMTVRRQTKIAEIVANYAERTVERVESALFCPHGHSRDEFGARRTKGVGKGNLYCRECQRVTQAEYMATKRREAVAA